MNQINVTKILLAVIIITLTASTVFFGLLYKEEKNALGNLLSGKTISDAGLDYLHFMNLFVEKVLKASGEIDFETRLKLETAVRDLKDEKILSVWRKFTDSQTEEEAQENVKDLLDLLTKKALSK